MSATRADRKAETNDAIRGAALALFGSRGYDETTAADIAAAAGVSERTFFRHFPTKDDVLFAEHVRRLAVLREALAARPDDEPTLRSIWAALRSLAAEFEADREHLLRIRPVMAGSAALTARSVELQGEFADAVAAHVAARRGLDPATELEPNLIGHAVVGAVTASIQTWLATGASRDLVALMERSLGMLERGLGSGAPTSVSG